MKKVVLFILLCGIILFLVFYFSFFEKDRITRHLGKWEVGMNLEKFSFKSFSNEENGGINKEILEVQRENTLVKINRIKTDFPKKYVEDRNFLFNSLFLPTTSPYPEVITNIIECPEEFRPKIKVVEKGTIYTLFAGERFNYGICAQDMIAYFSIYGIFDCKKKGIFEIQVFSKEEEEPGVIIGSFQCAN